MRLTGASTVKLVIAWTLIGMAPAILFSTRLKDRYFSDVGLTATVGSAKEPASVSQINELIQRLLSRDKLARVIQTYDLYGNGYSPRGFAALARVVLRWPGNPKSLDEAVEELKLNIRIEKGTNGTFYVSFNSKNPAVSAQVANQLGSLLIEDNLKHPAGDALKLVITNPARIAMRPGFPNRELIIIDGAIAGGLLGLIMAWFRRRSMQSAS